MCPQKFSSGLFRDPFLLTFQIFRDPLLTFHQSIAMAKPLPNFLHNKILLQVHKCTLLHSSLLLVPVTSSISEKSAPFFSSCFAMPFFNGLPLPLCLPSGASAFVSFYNLQTKQEAYYTKRHQSGTYNKSRRIDLKFHLMDLFI